MGERFNRNVLFTCLGSPGKPVVDTAGPLLLQPGDRVLLCSDGLWGTVPATPRSPSAPRPASPTAVPELVERRCAPAARKSDNVTVLASSGKRPRTRQRQPASPPSRWATRSSPPPSRPAWPAMRPGRRARRAEIERSIREINEAIQRSSKRKPL
jgi:PPM family protein phosphatase